MRNSKLKYYIRDKDLVNQIFNMLIFLNFIQENKTEEKKIKKILYKKLYDCRYIELMLKYFSDEYRKTYKYQIELRCNLRNIITDLDYLKLYVEELERKENKNI